MAYYRDPTVRLDLAPSLNWLTRRSVISAIHSGQLNIEPMSTTTLLEELSPSSIPGNHHTHVSCALCGAIIIDSPTSPSRSSFSPARPGVAGKAPWSPALLKTSLVQTITSASFGHPSRPATPTTPVTAEPPSYVYIFRLENTSSSGLPVSLPKATSQQGTQARPPTIYPLCASGWCLARLRTTCSLWAYVRTNVVEKVWDEEAFAPPSNVNSPRALGLTTEPHATSTEEKPAAQPRPSRIGIGALWGSMSRSLSNTRTKSESGQSESASPKPKEEPAKPEVTTQAPPVPPRRLPPPPPRNLPPPPPRHPPLDAPVPVVATGPPPPLPKRNRQRTASPVMHDSPSTMAPPNEQAHSPAHDEPVPAVPAADGVPSEDEGLETSRPTLTSNPSEDAEAFTTPVEELSSHPEFDRPTSPTSVPLPPTVPSTPVQESAELPAHDDAADRHATPPPAAAASGDKPPLPPRAPRPGAPPPLPRRAAARARPNSMVADSPETETAESTAAHETQCPNDEPAAGESHAVENHDEKADATEEQEQEQEQASVPIIQEPSEENDNEDVDRSEQPETEEDPAADAESSTVQDHVSTSAEHLPAISEAVSELAESIQYVDSSKEGSLRSLEEVPLANESEEAQQEKPDLQTVDASSEVEPLESISEDESGMYVGSSTWEERTWKELVKLREEMFWARIGGLR